MTGKSIESLADLIAARPLKTWPRQIAALDGATVNFRELTADGIDMFLDLGVGGQASFKRPEIVRFLSHTLCDSKGALIAQDAAALNAMPWEVVQELFQAAIGCMGLTRADLDEKKTD